MKKDMSMEIFIQLHSFGNAFFCIFSCLFHALFSWSLLESAPRRGAFIVLKKCKFCKITQKYAKIWKNFRKIAHICENSQNNIIPEIRFENPVELETF